MRILISTPDFPPPHGGIQLLMERLARNLETHEILVAAPDHAGARDFDRTLPYRVYRTDARFGRRSSLITLNVMLPLIARRFSAEAIISGHIMCAAGCVAARSARRAVLLQYVHADEVGHRSRLAGVLLPRADAVIAVSGYARRLAIDLGSAAQRVVVINPGVDPPPPAAHPSPREPVILTVARLRDRYKGFDVMLKAMPMILARVPRARWVLVGDGPLRPELEEAARLNGIERGVLFVGSVSDQERDHWFARARVFAMPSRIPDGTAGEGFGIVFLEAGRFGVPSVTANEGGAAEAVLNGVTGIQVDPRDHVAVASAICQMLENDELRSRYGAAARERAAELSWVKMARGVEQLLESIVCAAHG